MPIDVVGSRSASGNGKAVRDEGPGDLAQVENFLQALARAVRQFHTYPATSSHCVEAVQETHRVLNAVALDSLVCIVTPHELLVHGSAIGRNSPIEQELARRLHESRCETLAIDRTAAPRELARLCSELAAQRKGATQTLDERLRAHGVARISVQSAHEPVLLDVAATEEGCAIVEQDRVRAEAEPAAGRVAHMYPADKGWIRVDPALPLNQLTLSGLARLVEDPGSLATMLARLGGDAREDLPAADALEQHCSDVARLYTALDPAVARARLARLATAVLTLDSQRRRRLLSNTVLPALVDGRPEGEVLRDFPDVELADALSLLLDVEAAAPELLTTAFDRLQLPAERRAAMAPLLEQRIRAHGGGSSSLQHDAALEERTRQLVQIAAGSASFHDFATFDLCTDEATESIIAGTNAAMHATNLADVQLACVSQLIGLTARSESIEGLLRHAAHHLAELERARSFTEMANRLEALRRVASDSRDARPEITAAVNEAIVAFYTPARFDRLVTMHQAGGEQRTLANRLVAAAGNGLSTAVVRSLQERPGDHGILQLVCEHAVTLAPAIAKVLDQLPLTQRIAAIRTLAVSGRGSEASIARQLTHTSETVVRESLAALAQIGSEEAAEFLMRHFLKAGHVDGPVVEELLGHFAPAIGRHCLRTLLRQPRFVSDNPDLIVRLLARLDRRDASRLGDVLAPLTSLRFRFWNRRLARVGRQAAALVH